MSTAYMPDRIPEQLRKAKAELSAALLSQQPSHFQERLLGMNKSIPLIHAVGIGRKVRKGERTETMAVRIYVTRKATETDWPTSEKIPEFVNGVPTDVIVAAPADFLAMPATATCTLNRKARSRPVIGGISTSHVTGETGTIGYFCRSTETTDSASDVFILSNEHIFGNLGLASTGDLLIQHGALDGGGTADQIAGYSRRVPLVFGGGPNEVDAAIGKLDSATGYMAEICVIGKVPGTAQGEEDQLVAKHGRTSGYTEGVIDDESIDFVMLPKRSSKIIQFRNQMRIIPTASYPLFADGGDSGSLVVLRDKKEAVGLLHSAAIDGSYAYASHIDKVLSQLKIRLVV
jgi:hypothetical protein